MTHTLNLKDYAVSYERYAPSSTLPTQYCGSLPREKCQNPHTQAEKQGVGKGKED